MTPETGILHVSDRIGPLLGHVNLAADVPVRTVLNIVHPEDRLRLVRTAVSTLRHRAAFDLQLRARGADGMTRWLRVRGDVLSRIGKGPEPLQLLGVLQDITLTKATEAALIAAKQTADAASRAKSDFLSSMSHELRTPLNAILGFAQLLSAEPERLAVDQQENIEEIFSAGQHLLTLINEVLDLAKVEAGQLQLTLAPVPALPVIEECINLMRPQAVSRAIGLSYDPQQIGKVRVQADATRFKQILLNLLSNAIKYNHPNGSVTLAVDACADRNDRPFWRFLVTDTGPGIAEDKLEDLFQPFSRLETEIPVEGSGIGLVICRRLVENMGGEISVDSEPGVGSTFWFTLPEQ